VTFLRFQFEFFGKRFADFSRIDMTGSRSADPKTCVKRRIVTEKWACTKKLCWECLRDGNLWWGEVAVD
jgi:hypothetical protein